MGHLNGFKRFALVFRIPRYSNRWGFRSIYQQKLVAHGLKESLNFDGVIVLTARFLRAQAIIPQ